MSLTCSNCGENFKDFSEGGYVQNRVIYCPKCDGRPGIPVRFIEGLQVRVIYVQSIKEGLELIGTLK